MYTYEHILLLVFCYLTVHRDTSCTLETVVAIIQRCWITKKITKQADIIHHTSRTIKCLWAGNFNLWRFLLNTTFECCQAVAVGGVARFAWRGVERALGNSRLHFCTRQRLHRRKHHLRRRAANGTTNTARLLMMNTNWWTTCWKDAWLTRLVTLSVWWAMDHGSLIDLPKMLAFTP